MIGILWHTRLLRKITLTPEGFAAADINACIVANHQRANGVIHLYFHSSDLLPGGTPYCQDELDIRRFYKTLDDVIDHLTQRYTVTFRTLREIHSNMSDLADI
jgi:hypothetical protein